MLTEEEWEIARDQVENIFLAALNRCDMLLLDWDTTVGAVAMRRTLLAAEMVFNEYGDLLSTYSEYVEWYENFAENSRLAQDEQTNKRKLTKEK
jgi:hypothetical protein